MPTDLDTALVLAARLLLGGAFLFAGLRNATNVRVLTGLMSARGVPQARLALYAGIALQVVAGALVIAGVWTQLAAAALILFLVVATIMFDNFWDHTGIERGNRINGLVANIALLGGFLLVVATA
jgi:putative oxidoreductase